MRVILLFIVLIFISCAPQWVNEDIANDTEPDDVETVEPKQEAAPDTVDIVEPEKQPVKSALSIQMEPDVFERFKAEIQKFWQAPYVWGGASPQGTDCSGMIMTIYRNAADIKIPRSSRLMWQKGDNVYRDELRMGDLVFFNDNPLRNYPSHVGLYIDNGVFIHASSSKGVTTDKLADDYYKDRYIGARRFLD